MSLEPLGYWREGDDPGHRRFAQLRGRNDRGFEFEAGGSLPQVTVAYESWGTLNANRSNAVLVEHALTGDSHVTGPAGAGHPMKGWWDGIVGPGLAIDTDRFYVVCPNVLGGAQGTTGPSSLDEHGTHLGSRFPMITIRDQVDVEVALADYLGVARWYAVVGGSMGGMRVLEWAVGFASRLEQAVVLAVGAASTADQIALSSLQVRAIRLDPHYRGGDYYESETGPSEGMALARGIGHFTYRTGSEFEFRFGRHDQPGESSLEGGRYAIESYLEYQGDKLARRFDPNSYVVLSEAMNHHDVGRGRGGLREALSAIACAVTVISIDSDRLYPTRLQEQLVELVANVRPLQMVTSSVGHDGFLLEVDQIGAIIERALGG
ncbi:MAG: homoserine O-acetyltransferase [Acidimicrobiales bacterium]|jgi:homoserine O-acetyltransferase